MVMRTFILACLFRSIFAQDLLFTRDPSERQRSQFCGQEKPAEAENIMPEHRFDATWLDEKLRSTGLRMWVHGAVPKYKHYVATYRKEDAEDPMAFFKAQQFSLLPAHRQMAETLKQLHRHDEIFIKGQVFQNGSPLVHIRVTSLEIRKLFASPTQHDYVVPSNVFENRSNVEVFGMIHALTFSEELGWAMILESKDMIFPVVLPAAFAERARQLYRGDIVNAKLDIVHHPGGTTHFELKDGADSLEVVDALLHCHNQQKQLSGTLAKFDKSPAISLDVYAIRMVDENGMARNFTFFPADGLSQDEFMEVFMAISAKAKEAWERSSQVPIDRRNFREKPSVKVVANGVINVVSTEQANAQIMIRSADQVRFVVE